MKIEQIYTGCLAQGAYLIESEGEAAIIDPLREIHSYLDKTSRHGTKIKYIFETHFHADFVSGHVDLSKATGAPIIYGPKANPTFEAHIAADNEEFKIGKITMKVLHTPGHTMESTCYLLIDEEGKPNALFTGDTLFIGDVGRPDLAQKQNELTTEDLAGMLYDSLRDKILVLPDEVIIYPGHGAGSACGKNMSKETVSTLGIQKKLNYALQESLSKADFIIELTDGLMPPPAYFPMNVQMNKEGYESIHNIIKKGVHPIPVSHFEDLVEETGALVLDTRSPDAFVKGFIPNSIFIGLDGNFAPWVGALVPVGQQIVLVTEPGREEETVTRLARIGYDNTLGFLEGGMQAWIDAGKETDTIESVNSQILESAVNEKPLVFDVRRPAEYNSEHMETAVLAPLDFLNEHLSSIPKDQPAYVHCAGGYRSVIAISILKARGWNNLINVEGGFAAMKKTGIPLSQNENSCSK
jgi:hydroxyacylglutathione hydrolase